MEIKFQVPDIWPSQLFMVAMICESLMSLTKCRIIKNIEISIRIYMQIYLRKAYYRLTT